MAKTFIMGSRPSKLALWQTENIISEIKSIRPDLLFRVNTLMTEGDKILDRPLPEIGGKGLFTSELESALLSGEIDLAVHSLKDLPVENLPGIHIGAITRRADARDVLISASKCRFVDLPPKARLGTSSLRRSAQAKAARPDLQMMPLRGNVDTRVLKAIEGQYDAIILAAAGIERLNLADHVSEYLSFDLMLPAPGQGALAVQCRSSDSEMLEVLKQIHNPATGKAVTAERTFLSALGAGCSAPVAAYARTVGDQIEIIGLVASLDGCQIVRVSAVGMDPLEVGKRLAEQALEKGAGDLLQ